MFALPLTRRLLGLKPIGPAAVAVTLGSILDSFVGIRIARRSTQDSRISAPSPRLHFVRG